jgi:hypothetical protein
MSIDAEELQDIRYVNACLGFYNISVGELWLRYFRMGGVAREYEVDEHLRGARTIAKPQRELLRMALTEAIGENSNAR